MRISNLPSGYTLEKQEIHAYRCEQIADKYFYLLGGVHGDEVEGIYVTQKLFEWLSLTDDIGLPLVIVPIVNPDGYRNRQRTNDNGVDLNRNLPTQNWSPQFENKLYNPGPAPLSEPENKFLDKLFQKYPPAFILTMHSYKPMLNYNGNCHKLAQFLADFNHYRVTDDIGYPTPGSLGTYAPEKYDAPVLTFECPKLNSSLSLDQIWEENAPGLKALFQLGYEKLSSLIAP